MELFPKDVMLAIQEQIKMVRLTKSLCLSNEEIPPPPPFTRISIRSPLCGSWDVNTEYEKTHL